MYKVRIDLYATGISSPSVLFYELFTYTARSRLQNKTVTLEMAHKSLSKLI